MIKNYNILVGEHNQKYENRIILATFWHKQKSTYPFDEVSVSFSVRSILDPNQGSSD